MATSKYELGAYWERRVLKHLMGDDKSIEPGYLHSLISAAQSKYPDITPPALYSVRAAGSRGPFDLIIVGSHTHTSNHIVLGIQCKTKKLSYRKMDNDLTNIYREYGIHGVYAYREKNQPKFYPDLPNLIFKLVVEYHGDRAPVYTRQIHKYDGVLHG